MEPVKLCEIQNMSVTVVNIINKFHFYYTIQEKKYIISVKIIPDKKIKNQNQKKKLS